MNNYRRALQTIGFLLAGLGAVLADSDKITSKNSVQDKNIPGGVDVMGEGNDFVIQGDFPEFPETLPAVTQALEKHFVPPPRIFVPPTTTVLTDDVS